MFGAQRVELLRARDARHAVDCEHVDAPARELLEQLGVLARPHEAHEHLLGTQPAELVDVAARLGRTDLEDHVAGLVQRVGRIEDLRARLAVRAVLEARAAARAGLDADREPELDQLHDHVRCRRNTALAGMNLARHAYLHPLLLRGRQGRLGR